jgi:uncharacterized membrane protein YraQ (UPF0718 family)
MLSFVLLSITLTALMVSFWKDRERTRKALLLSYRSFMALVPSLLGMTGLVGLVLGLIPQDMLSNLFKFHGIEGFVLIALVGAIVTMPAPVAFPLAGSLLKLGASLPDLAAFITTLTMVGLVTAPMEMAYFGKRFTIVRQSLSFILAIMIGVLMGAFL